MAEHAKGGRSLRAAVLVAAGLAAAGCTVVGSNALDLSEAAACTSALGAYYLPKHYVTIALKRVSVSGSGATTSWLDAKGRGAYELIKFKGDQGIAGPNEVGRPLRVQARPDPEYGFCLDYLATLTTKDRLIVERDNGSGLLARVTTKGSVYNNAPGESATAALSGESESKNESELIAQRIIQTVFTGISGRATRCDSPELRRLDKPLDDYCKCLAGQNRSQCSLSYVPPSRESFDAQHRGEFGDRNIVKVPSETDIEDSDSAALNVDFDPTDPHETAMFNMGLTAHDHCAFLGDGKVDLKYVKEYCNDPAKYAQTRGFRPRAKAAPAQAQRELPAFRSYKGGVLYRVRVTYPFYIFKRSGDRWQLIAQEKVELATTGPIVSVGVDRAVFASRNTEILFDDGMLFKINIKRESELAAFAGIPLALVTSIAKLPSQVLLMKIDQTTDTAEFIKVNQAILEAQGAYTRTLTELSRAQADAGARGPLGTQDPDRRSKLLQACETVLRPQQGVNALETCRTIVDQTYNQ